METKDIPMVEMGLPSSTVSSDHSHSDDEIFEQNVIDYYFTKLDTLRTFMSSNTKLFGLLCFYFILTTLAVIGVSISTLVSDAKVLLIVFVLIQVFTTLTCVQVTKNVLGNESMCNAYVEYNVKIYLGHYPGLSPVMSLYFSNIRSGRIKKKTDIQTKMRMNTYIIRVYYLYFIAIIAYTLYAIAASVVERQKATALILPFIFASFLNWQICWVMFHILDSSLEYHKMEFLKSPFFHNEVWDKIVVNLATNSKFRKQGGLKNFTVSLVDDKKEAEQANEIDDLSSRYQSECEDGSQAYQIKAFNPMQRAQSTESTNNERTISQSTDTSALDKFKSAFDIHHLVTVQKAAKQLISKANIAIATQRRVHNHKHEKSSEVMYSLLSQEKECLDFDRFRHDLYVLQHAYQVQNYVLGIAYSVFAVLTIANLLFSIFLTFEFNRVFEGPPESSSNNIKGTGQYMTFASVVNIGLMLQFMLKHNSFAPAIASFCSPILLLCDSDKIDDILSIRNELVNMNLYIRIFGIAVTQDWILSLIFSLLLSVSGQLYFLIVRSAENA